MTPHRLAHEVLLPATAASELTPRLGELLAGGCRSILLGETRDEYLQRAMSAERRAKESAEGILRLVEDARSLASDGKLLVAIDHELAGIQRFEHLIGVLPSVTEASAMPSAELVDRVRASAESLSALGVTVVLGPIVDVVRGSNSWLAGRNLGADSQAVGRIGASVVEGLQAGGVAACVKHFPGNPVVTADPAVEEAEVRSTSVELETLDLPPFRRTLASGARAVMLAPTVVPVVDGQRSASLSPLVIELLRDRLGFQGAVVTDDLDARSIVRGRDLGAVAVDAIGAGADLLLVGEDGAAVCAQAIADACGAAFTLERLSQAAERVRELCNAAAPVRAG